MADENKIGLEAVFENADFQRGVSEYNSSIDQASANTEEASGNMSLAWTGLAAVGEVVWAGLAAGIAAVGIELGFAANAAMDTEEVLTQVGFVVDNLAERTGVTSEEVFTLADSLSQVLPIDDEVIAQAIAMGLTFDGVNEDNIQPLIMAAADLAAFTGKDLPAAMKELSLAITDPERAMRLFKDANITLTEEEKKTLQGFKDIGDTAGATNFILEELKNKGIIGLGEVMGDTAKGKLTIMQTALGNLQEALGAGLLDALKGVFDKITAFANDPRTTTFLTELGNKIGDVAEQIISKLPDVFAVIDGIIEWLSNNKPIIIGILAALGVAMLAFAATTASAAITAISALAPIIAAMVAIGAVVALIAKAWEEDWGGIQGKVKEAWTQIRPVFEKLQAWLKVNLPKALKFLSDLWTKTLLPAIKAVIAWVVNNVLPALVKLVLWLGDNVPKAIKATSDFFTKTLIPAIKAVGDWIENTLIPILEDMRDWFETHIVNAIKALVDIIKGALTTALNALAALWNNVLLPAITAVYNFINNNVIPIFNAVANIMRAVVGAAINFLANLWNNVLVPALQNVWNFIKNNIIPIFQAVSNLMNAVVGLAVRVLAGLWNNVLVPALQNVWEWINDNIIPIFVSVANIMSGIVSTAIQIISNLWNNVLVPALQAVWNWISNNIIPIFNSVSSTMSGALSTATTALSNLWNNILKPAIEAVWDILRPFAEFLTNVLERAFDAVRAAVQWLVDLINDLAEAINNIELPPWLQPGSPTPFELGLKGINEQLAKMSKATLPAIRHQMEILGTVRDVAGTGGNGASNTITNSSSSTRTYLFGTQVNLPSPSGLIETLQGLT